MKENLSYLSQYYDVFSKTQIISKTDTEGIITSANENFCKISGYSEAELVGFSHNKIRHPDTKAAVFEKMWKTISSGKIWKGEVKNSTKKRGFYWTKSIIFPIFDNKKNIIEYVSFREDITKRKLLELKIAKEDSLRREILHSQPNMVILVHKSKGVIFMNHQCFADLPFNSRVGFLEKHTCICELFIEKDGFLKKSTKERHWLKGFYEKPNHIHKAVILNRQNKEQIYHVSISEFEDNKNLIVINFLNITEFEDCKEELTVDQEKIKLSELKIQTTLKVIEKELENKDANTNFLEELKSILTKENNTIVDLN